MTRNQIFIALGLLHWAAAFSQKADTLRLVNYRPVSIYRIPETKIIKAKYPVIDMHSHDYLKSNDEVKDWIKTMDDAGIAKTIILSYSTGRGFDSVMARYGPYPDRFEVWCGFDFSSLGKPDWPRQALSELERCHKLGAKGVGELGDKGLGEFYSRPSKGSGLHVDDPRIKPLLQKCGELGMPISVHVAEDAWMYLNTDSANDGLMNAATWKVDLSRKGIIGHDELIRTLENAVRENPKTIFVACHLANSCADLNVLGGLFDRYPNLYADIAARYGEIAPIPRFVHNFMERYASRLVYGTDMGTEAEMYHITFRILESADEHFYMQKIFDYHWPLYGLSLSDGTLEKLYNGNAKKILVH